MKKGSISFFELHVEKLVLGLAAVFAIAMAWLYLVGSPNTVEYRGKLTPGQLDEAILDSAKELERKIAQVEPTAEPVPEYSELLDQRQSEGLFSAAATEGGPAVARTLHRTAAFGTPIVVPGLEQLERAEDVKVVTPLRPERPQIMTGKSLVYATQAKLQSATTPGSTGPVTPVADVKPKETSWVTVAAYFPEKAQKDEMTAAGYAPYRAIIYFSGVDAQRQEMLANGQWSEWKDVTPAKAMPRVDIPDPTYDDKTGEMLNKQEVDEAFDIVRQDINQSELIQPTFYDVDAGDDWQVPPIEGYEPKLEEEDKEKDEPKHEVIRDTRIVPQPPVRPPSDVIGPGRNPRAPVTGRDPYSDRANTRGSSDAKAKSEGRARARDDLKAARKAMAEKNYDEARQRLNAVLGNQYATSGYKRQAEKLSDLINRFTQTGGPSPLISQIESGAILRRLDPQKPDPALWFHDDSVEPGKTYRYRLRARVWNRYVGRLKAVADEESAKKTELLGEWSLPSDPVTVAPDTYFFVRGPKIGEPDVVSADVWKWRDGYWVKETFDARVGDVIGGVKNVRLEFEFDEDGSPKRVDMDFTTGAVVLDLRADDSVFQRRTTNQEQGQFNMSKTNSLTVVYLDPADGQVKEKTQLADRYDPTRQMLEKQEL